MEWIRLFQIDKITSQLQVAFCNNLNCFTLFLLNEKKLKILHFPCHSQDYSVASATLPHNMSSVNSDMSNHHHQTNASRSNTLNRRNSNLMAMNHNIIPPPDVTHTHSTKMMPPMIVSSGASSLYSSKPNNVLPGILKDRKCKFNSLKVLKN